MAANPGKWKGKWYQGVGKVHDMVPYQKPINQANNFRAKVIVIKLYQLG